MLPPFKDREEIGYWLIVGNRKAKVIFTKIGERVYLDFNFNRPLMEEVKAMQGAKWHGYEDPPIKKWSILDTHRNRFQLSYMIGMNPYVNYEKPLLEYTTQRTPYNHQQLMTRAIITYHYLILAAEMGVGKSLSAIEAMEFVKLAGDAWWIAPKSALNSTRLELDKWKSKVRPELYTYDNLKKVLEDWPKGKMPPQFVIFDEASRAKNPTAQRSQAVLHLADSVRQTWGDNGYVVEMSGSPAPRNPGDWWHLCEIACPGFIKEGNQQKFIQRLAITKKNESAGGGFYNTILGWKDDVKRCNECGQMQEHMDHNLAKMIDNPHVHVFVPVKNEVAYLYERMKGLVHVHLKKDCLDLPDKIYRLIKLKPNIDTVNAARMLAVQAPSAIQKLTRLRELSDGFQYREEKTGTEPCSANCKSGVLGDDPCITCGGRGVTDVFVRTYAELPTPKEQALEDILDEHEEVGRLVVYASFTASIDRCVKLAQKNMWDIVRVDGRGWSWITQDGSIKTELEMLKTFQREGGFDASRVCFIGHPGSAGMGLTLTASPTILYYSNDFNFESRVQSEDRIHRAGMDVARGATIIDLIHLPTDNLVLQNLKKKRDLQALSLGELKECLEGADV